MRYPVTGLPITRLTMARGFILCAYRCTPVEETRLRERLMDMVGHLDRQIVAAKEEPA